MFTLLPSERRASTIRWWRRVPGGRSTSRSAWRTKKVEKELFIQGGIPGLLIVELRQDTRWIGGQALVFDWSRVPTRYSFFGGLPPEPSAAGILEPGVALRSTLTVRLVSGEPFPVGTYELRLRLAPDRLKRADGCRGTVGAVLLVSSFSCDRAQPRRTESGSTRCSVRKPYSMETTRRRHAIFRAMLDETPLEKRGWAGLGLAYFRLKKHGLAAEAFEHSVAKADERILDSSLADLLVESYVVLGEDEKALRTLRRFGDQADTESALARVKERVRAKRRNAN